MTRGRRAGAIGVAMLALVVGCAAPEPGHGDLKKGAYRPPVRAPTFSPTDDAPHTFRPGQPPQVEPGPRPTRVLPETPTTRRGPGLWATTPPVASSEPGHAPEMFNWDAPLPEDDDEAAARIKACANDMRATSPTILRQYDIDRLDRIAKDAWRACWPHSLVLYCLVAEQKAMDPLRPLDQIRQKHWDTLDRAIERAQLSWAEHCNAAPWRPDMEPLVIRAANARGRE
jgi:hypothetical protein